MFITYISPANVEDKISRIPQEIECVIFAYTQVTS